MKSFLMKAWSTLAISSLAVTGLHADYTRSGQVTVMPGSSCNDCCCDKVEPCYGYAYNPPIFFEDCCGWFADIEFLYWKPCQAGVSYGAVYTARLNSPFVDHFDVIGTIDGVQKYPKFEWDAGFRVGLGYRLPCDCWEVVLRFTHFRTENCGNCISGQFDDVSDFSADCTQGQIFAPAYSTVVDFFLPTDFEIWKVCNDWKVHLNQLDLQFAREFFVGRCVTLRPFAGLRALFLEQRYNIDYLAEGTAFTSDVEALDLKEYVKMKDDFKGTGLIAGLESTYGFGCGLAFYGSATGALVYGQFDVVQRDEITFSSGASTGAASTFRFNQTKTDNHTCLLAGADLEFGLRWRQAVNCDRNAFTLKLGWEHHVLFDYNKYRSLASPALSNVVNNNPSGNLYFYGIVFAATIDF